MAIIARAKIIFDGAVQFNKPEIILYVFHLIIGWCGYKCVCKCPRIHACGISLVTEYTVRKPSGVIVKS